LKTNKNAIQNPLTKFIARLYIDIYLSLIDEESECLPFLSALKQCTVGDRFFNLVNSNSLPHRFSAI